MTPGSRVKVSVSVLAILALLEGCPTQAGRARRQTAAGSSQLSVLDHLAPILPSNSQGDGGTGTHLNTLLQMVTGTKGQSYQGKSAAMDSLLQLANSMQYSSAGDIQEVTLQGANGADGPVVSVVSQTLTVDDLLASQNGRQQLQQLNMQLEHAVDVVGQEVHMTQQQLQQTGGAGSSSQEMLSGLLGLLTEAESGHLTPGMLQAVAGIQQVREAVQQLPALNGVVQRVSAVLDTLLATHTSSATQLQSLLAALTHTLQASLAGNTDVARLTQQAVDSLTTNLATLEALVQHLQQTVANPTFLHALDDTHCLAQGLSGDVTTPRAARCMHSLLRAASPTSDSHGMVPSLTEVLTQLTHSPSLLTRLVEAPSLDQAVAMVTTALDQLEGVGSQLAKTVNTALSSVVRQPQLLQGLLEVMRRPETLTLMQQVQHVLLDAGLQDGSTRQVLTVVNDTLALLWRSGDGQQTAERLAKMLRMLEGQQDAGLPLSQAQEELVEVLLQLINTVLSANATITPLPATVTSPPPSPTATPSPTTPLSTTTTTRPSASEGTTVAPTQTTSTASPPPATAATTARPGETEDGNGAVGAGMSCTTLLLALWASVLLM